MIKQNPSNFISRNTDIGCRKLLLVLTQAFADVGMKLQAIVREFDSRYIDGTMDSGGQYRLDVDINTLIFQHHELMSREHVLASRLSSLAHQYQERRLSNVVEYYSQKVRDSVAINSTFAALEMANSIIVFNRSKPADNTLSIND